MAQRDTWVSLGLAALALCACTTTTDDGAADIGPDGGDAADAGGPIDDASSALDDDACESLEPHRYQTCLIDPWSDAEGGALEGVYELELIGTVEAIEEDVRCTGVGSASQGGVGYGVRIVGEGEGATLGFTLPFTQALFEVGETLHVKYERGPEPFASGGWPPTGSVVIRDTEGQLLYCIAETLDGFDALDVPPELTITEGRTSCTYGGSYCGNATRSSVFVDLEPSVGLIEVPYGKNRDVGDYVILLADNERHESPDDTLCPANHRISIAAARGSLGGPGTPGFGTSF